MPSKTFLARAPVGPFSSVQSLDFRGCFYPGPVPLLDIYSDPFSIGAGELVFREDLSNAVAALGGGAYVIAVGREPIAFIRGERSEHVRLTSQQRIRTAGRLEVVAVMGSDEAWLLSSLDKKVAAQHLVWIDPDGRTMEVCLPQRELLMAIRDIGSVDGALIALVVPPDPSAASILQWHRPTEAPTTLSVPTEMRPMQVRGRNEIVLTGIVGRRAAVARSSGGVWRVTASEVEADLVEHSVLDERGFVWFIAKPPGDDVRRRLLRETANGLVVVSLATGSGELVPSELMLDPRAGMVLRANHSRGPTWLLMERPGWGAGGEQSCEVYG